MARFSGGGQEEVSRSITGFITKYDKYIKYNEYSKIGQMLELVAQKLAGKQLDSLAQAFDINP